MSDVYRIKPLRWRKMPSGRYLANQMGIELMPLPFDRGYSFRCYSHASLKAAKMAAEAWYRNTLLEALEAAE